MSDPLRDVADSTGRRKPAGWPWALVGGVLIVAAVVLRYGPMFELDPIDPHPARGSGHSIRVSPELRPVDRVPADAAALRDCNVLFVTLDTTRADRIGCYGYAGIRTPALDGLAREGVLFSGAFAPTPTTIPSHCSMMTGLYPHHHGARANGQRLDESKMTLAELLSNAGYVSAAFVSSFVLDSRFGLAQGFAHYDDRFELVDGGDGAAAAERRADATTDRALAWLGEHVSQRLFMWVHFFDPHDPYDPPQPYRDRYANAYDGEIAFADAQLGRLLAAIDDAGLTDTTLVVVAADHGESLGEHEELTHGFLIYNATLRVPMIMRCGAKIGAGVHVSRNVSLVDITPTVLSLLGISIPPHLDGVDLTLPPQGTRSIFAETLHGTAFYGWAPLLGVVEGSSKLIYGPRSELYDIEGDPFERSNVFDSRSQVAGALRLRVESLFGSDLDKVASSSSLRLSVEEIEKLQALGYAGGALPRPSSATPGPHPRDMMSLMNRVQYAAALGHGGGHAKAIAQLERIIADHPHFTPPYEYLADLYRRQRDYEGVATTLNRYIKIRPDDPRPLLMLADLHVQTGAVDQAIKLQRRSLVMNPDHFAATFALGRLLQQAGQHAEAADLFGRALRLRPRDERLPEMYVELMISLSRLDEAEAHLKKLIEVEKHLPFVSDALHQLEPSDEAP